MLLYAREDTHLNCIEEVVKKADIKPAPTPAPESTEGSVFDQAEWEVKQEKKQKPQKTERKDNFLVRWTKKSLKAGEDFVGGLYDKMEEN